MTNATITTNAIYKNGIIIPARKPPFKPKDVVVMYIPEKSTKDTENLKKALSNAFGILKKGKIPKGTIYESELREEREDKTWLEGTVRETATRLYKIEADLPKSKVSKWNKAMAHAVKPAQYIPGKGVVIQN